MKLIDTYQSVEKREILDCRMKSLKEWARNYGHNLSSLEILLICEGITFCYDRITVPKLPNIKLPYAVVSNNDVEEIFFQRLRINYKKEEISSDEAGWRELKRLVDHDIPVLFKIDSRFLKEEGVKREVSKQLNLYYVSTLLLVGYDLLKNEVYIILNNNDIISTYNKISLNEFQKYRRTVCNPFSPNEKCYYVEDRAGIDLNQELIYEKTMEGLKKIIYNMIEDTKVIDMDLGGFIGEGTIKGIFGMKRLRDELEDIYDECKKNTNFSILQLAAVFLRNNIMFGSYSAFRFEFSKCLDFIGNKYGMKHLCKKSEFFIDISGNWKKLFIALSKVTHMKENIYINFSELVKTLDDIIKKESEQFMRLSELI